MKVEGVNYEIDWKRFHRGTSIFIPCLNGKAAMDDIRPVLRRLGYKVVKRREVVGGIMGLRLWRI